MVKRLYGCAKFARLPASEFGILPGRKVVFVSLRAHSHQPTTLRIDHMNPPVIIYFRSKCETFLGLLVPSNCSQCDHLGSAWLHATDARPLFTSVQSSWPAVEVRAKRQTIFSLKPATSWQRTEKKAAVVQKYAPHFWVSVVSSSSQLL